MLKLSKHTKKVNDTFIFTGKKMEVFIPRRYERYNLLSIGNEVKTLGIFEIKIDDNLSTGFLLPAVLTLEPSSIYTKTIEETDYLICQFVTGDKFISNSTLVKQSFIPYVLFLEFIALGRLPSFITYDIAATLFDLAKETCNVGFRTNHTVFEMIWSHLFRDANDLTTKYRHTNMKNPPEFIELKSVTYAAESTSAKLIGAYMSDGVNAAIVNPANEKNDLEDLLRS